MEACHGQKQCNLTASPNIMGAVDDFTKKDRDISKNIYPKEAIDLFFKNMITERRVARQWEECIFQN